MAQLLPYPKVLCLNSTGGNDFWYNFLRIFLCGTLSSLFWDYYEKFTKANRKRIFKSSAVPGHDLNIVGTFEGQLIPFLV